MPRRIAPALALAPALAALLLATAPATAQTYPDCAIAAAEARGTGVSAVSEVHVAKWTRSFTGGWLSARMRIDGAHLACNAVPGAPPVVIVLPSEAPDMADAAQKAACIAAFAARVERPDGSFSVLWSIRWPDGSAWARLRGEGIFDIDLPWDVDCAADAAGADAHVVFLIR